MLPDKIYSKSTKTWITKNDLILMLDYWFFHTNLRQSAYFISQLDLTEQQKIELKEINEKHKKKGLG